MAPMHRDSIATQEIARLAAQIDSVPLAGIVVSGELHTHDALCAALRADIAWVRASARMERFRQREALWGPAQGGFRIC